MKRIYSALAALMVAVSISAIPAKPGQWRTITLSDGTEVKAELVGDEFSHYYRSADGVCYQKDAASGLFRQVALADLQAMRKQTVAAERLRRQQAQPALDGVKRSAASTKKTVYSGNKRGLVILVNFKDKTFAEGHDKALYEKILNQENYTDASTGFVGSVYDYFKAQSNGKFLLNFDIVGPVTMPQSYQYYGQELWGQMLYVQYMVQEALKQSASQVSDWSQYDWDGDGYVDQVFFLYAGYNSADHGDDAAIWPHMSSIQRYTVAKGTYVSTYACSSELQYGGAVGGIGAFCHEFSHCMGLPDLYDTGGGSNFGTGDWDIMCSGNYNGDSYCPAGYTAYEKWLSGWLDPIELNTEAKTVTGMKALSDGGEAYVMYNDGNKNEYYLLENRQQTGWDAGLPGAGLLITHVDYDATVWDNNAVNNDASHQRVAVVPCDNTASQTTYTGDPWPYKGNKAFTNTSTPAATLFNANTDGTYLLNKYVKAITQNTDGTISFNYLTKAIDDASKPAGSIFYETFDLCAGTGGNDNTWTGDNIGGATMTPDMDGWEGNNAQGADKCALYGKTNQRARITTPQFTQEQDTYVTFKAAPVDNTTNPTLTLSVKEGTGTLETTSFALTPGAWTTISTKLSGTGTMRLYLQINSGRMYIDDFCVSTQAPTAINGITIDKSLSESNAIYTIDGRYVGTDAAALAKGIYVKGGKKFVK